LVLANLFGVSPAVVFKTLVVARPPKKPILAIVPADKQLDLKKLAQALGEKKLKMATHAQAEQLTGLQVGGISPLALLNKGFVMVIDRSAESLPHIYLSAGQKGTNLKVPVKPVLKLIGARPLDIT
jgi:Cys-tRNA(Pro)/Cys-tRNA(Cys) deacylase